MMPPWPFNPFISALDASALFYEQLTTTDSNMTEFQLQGEGRKFILPVQMTTHSTQDIEILMQFLAGDV